MGHLRGTGRRRLRPVVSIHHLVHAYGYGAVFLLVMLESMAVPVPGETVLTAAAVYAGTSHNLDIVLVFLVGAAGAVTGDNLGYWVGAKGGYALLRRYGRYVGVRETEVKIGRYLFDRHGGKVVFFGRLIVILRTYAAFLAGTNRMRWRRFLLFNTTGGVLWAAGFSFVSYWGGKEILAVPRAVQIATVAGIVTVVVAGLVLTRRRLGRLAGRAEAAYPGPLSDGPMEPRHRRR